MTCVARALPVRGFLQSSPCINAPPIRPACVVIQCAAATRTALHRYAVPHRGYKKVAIHNKPQTPQNKTQNQLQNQPPNQHSLSFPQRRPTRRDCGPDDINLINRQTPFKPRQETLLWWQLWFLPFLKIGLGSANISMSPTLLPGSTVFMTPYVNGVTELRRGDVVMFQAVHDGGNPYVKRIVGLPRDTVKAQFHPGYSIKRTVKVPDGHFWFEGDNVEGSLDSRVLGPFPIDAIIAKVWCSINPSRWLPGNDVGANSAVTKKYRSRVTPAAESYRAGEGDPPPLGERDIRPIGKSKKET